MKIKIAGDFYEHFNGVTISTSLDAVASTFAFSAIFNPADKWHRKIFKPLTYPKIEFLQDSGLPISTGRLISHGFKSQASPENVACSGYSLGGVLEDCPIPYSLYPLESNNRSLKEIATRLLNHFGLKLVVYDIVAKECNEKISKTVADPEESISGYLAKIAAQKNVVMSHDVYGNVIFFRPDVKAKPKAFYTTENTETMSFEVNGQGMHSAINTLRQPSKKQKGSSTLSPVDSVKNPLVLADRPTLDVLTSGADTDTLKGAKNTLASELKNIVLSLSFKHWEPISIGDMVEVQNAELYLNDRIRFMVSETTISESNEEKSMEIKCVLPETFTGDTPKNIFI